MARGWFQCLFGSGDENREHQDVNDLRSLEDDTPFIFTQHMRILLAIAVTFIAACVLWWIMAA